MPAAVLQNMGAKSWRIWSRKSGSLNGKGIKMKNLIGKVVEKVIKKIHLNDFLTHFYAPFSLYVYINTIYGIFQYFSL